MLSPLYLYVAARKNSQTPVLGPVRAIDMLQRWILMKPWFIYPAVSLDDQCLSFPLATTRHRASCRISQIPTRPPDTYPCLRYPHGHQTPTPVSDTHKATRHLPLSQIPTRPPDIYPCLRFPHGHQIPTPVSDIHTAIR